MPQPKSVSTVRASRKTRPGHGKVASRYSVGLPAALADKVEKYAESADLSASRAISTLVRLGLEGQESRKREFFKRLKENLAESDSKQQDRLVDEFRALILGH